MTMIQYWNFIAEHVGKTVEKVKKYLEEHVNAVPEDKKPLRQNALDRPTDKPFEWGSSSGDTEESEDKIKDEDDKETKDIDPEPQGFYGFYCGICKC